MAETQDHIKILLLDTNGKSIGDAIRNGNNAAWMCVCGYQFPLIWSGHIAIKGKKNEPPVPYVICNKCGNKYTGDKEIPTKIMKV